MSDASLYIDGAWTAGRGEAVTSLDPATGEACWQGRGADAAQVDEAVAAARGAFPAWARLSVDERTGVVERFAAMLRERRESLAGVIAEDTGKPLWEARGEVDAMIAKVAISRQARDERTGERVLAESPVRAELRHCPHGVMAVFGPFNFPGHLPNGHIVPALLAGNTVVFKPSEQAPAVAEATVHAWVEAGLPAGVMNLVQGGADTGRALASARGIDGLLFTGSEATGLALHEGLARQPQKILALEMGGNNPLVVLPGADPRAAALLTLQSAFATAGQRCSCARRLYLPRGREGDRLLEALTGAARALRVGDCDDDPEVFMGPVISDAAARVLVHAQERLAALGGRVIEPLAHLREGTGRVRPGLVDVEGIDVPDEEWFGPLLRVSRHDGLDDAIARCNDTRFGLSAGLIGGDAAAFERFRSEVRAGVVNWNRPLTGASSAAPFGGVGVSGNHRPGAYYAADYCAYPVASLMTEAPALPETLPPGVTL
ncbi:N-succinylglutamate 5-semialdehyde dehydrogenase [wastewater metagenome]|uniref:N-succinylglutamate 5-semialdehyde dehydrogenase n=2 Tax=unclassified sequences TaxID=12908 RepID=A0A5B8RFE3_9ZZZZ|nr:succinylglutamate-semialdehyde dehydrogenase [Arhodomonas sp. KWT]QEA07306.1 N-succinylglutamate 5-semialdehyde dehydrogenase [uncultured organism]